MRFHRVCYGFGSCHDTIVLRSSGIKNKIWNMVAMTFLFLEDKAFRGFRNIRIVESTRAFPISEDDSYKLKVLRLVVEQSFWAARGKI